MPACISRLLNGLNGCSMLYSLPRCGGVGMVSFWCLHASLSCWPALGDEMQHIAQHGLQRQSRRRLFSVSKYP